MPALQPGMRKRGWVGKLGIGVDMVVDVDVDVGPTVQRRVRERSRETSIRSRPGRSSESGAEAGRAMDPVGEIELDGRVRERVGKEE